MLDYLVDLRILQLQLMLIMRYAVVYESLVCFATSTVLSD